jgi:hypothetical protein
MKLPGVLWLTWPTLCSARLLLVPLKLWLCASCGLPLLGVRGGGGGGGGGPEALLVGAPYAAAALPLPLPLPLAAELAPAPPGPDSGPNAAPLLL